MGAGGGGHREGAAEEERGRKRTRGGRDKARKKGHLLRERATGLGVSSFILYYYWLCVKFVSRLHDCPYEIALIYFS